MTVVHGPDMSRRAFIASLLAILAAAAVLRIVYPTADPPWQVPVGITWHDEGPWVHNARNKVLWGQWSMDQWNPMYLTPVFTGLEYAAFRTVGVGQWQARTVSQGMGLLAVAAIALGLSAVAGRRVALLGAALLATNYVSVMWDRVALMEATMTAFIALSWSAYAAARRRPALGLAAGAAAVLAFFTKAAAAFFIAAIGLEVAWALWPSVAARFRHARRPGREAPAPHLSDTAPHVTGPVARLAATAEPNVGPGVHPRPDLSPETRAAAWTLAGLVLAGGAFLLWFVLPHWTEFRFYNWQMSVTRKPSYGLQSLVDRASWLPVVNDFFSRMWLMTVVTIAGCLALLARWRTSQPAERLLLLWIGLGIAELIVHDAGNLRRLIFFIPAFAVASALVLGTRGRSFSGVTAVTRRGLLLILPVLLYAAYVVIAPIVRLAHIYEVRPAVRGAAAAAAIVTAGLYVFWPGIRAWLSRQRWPFGAAAAVVLIVIAGDLVQFSQWASARSYHNVAASRVVGSLLPPGTLVQGKLANGLALENRIKPIFVGRGFGNYDDRLSRDDVRYVLTYVTPWLGYEGPVILDVLDASPGWRILKTFDVAETGAGHDRAALIEKPLGAPALAPTGRPSAHD